MLLTHQTFNQENLTMFTQKIALTKEEQDGDCDDIVTWDVMFKTSGRLTSIGVKTILEAKENPLLGVERLNHLTEDGDVFEKNIRFSEFTEWFGFNKGTVAYALMELTFSNVSYGRIKNIVKQVYKNKEK